MPAQVDRSLAVELEFDKVLELVAAHARTHVGRVVIQCLADLSGDTSARVRSALLTRAVADLIEEDGVLSLAGVDEAVPWLEENAPPPSEPRDLIALLTLARRVAAIRRRLEASDNVDFDDLLNRLPDTGELVKKVAPKLSRDGTIADDASPELGRVRREIARARSDVLAELEAVRRAPTAAGCPRKVPRGIRFPSATVETMTVTPSGVVAAGATADKQPVLWISEDGTDFNVAHTLPASGWVGSIAYGDGWIVAAGSKGGLPDEWLPAVWVSTDGRDWQAVPLAGTYLGDGGLSDVAYHDGRFVAAGQHRAEIGGEALTLHWSPPAR